MKYPDIREEELKNKIAQDIFWKYDCSKIIGNVDFCVSFYQSDKEPFEHESLMWAEAKSGKSDIYKSLVQLILTIGKARTFDKMLPPAFIGAFDGEKIAFIPYNEIHEVFYLNDFNWKVTPSNHDTAEFKLIYEKVKMVIDSKALLFNLLNDDRELKKFIKENFIVGKFGLTKTRIDKNNFMFIYNKWLQSVKPTIAVKWENAKKIGLIDGDFYLADLLSYENKSLKEKLYIFLKQDHYEMDRGFDEMGLQTIISVFFADKQVAHTQFWNKYERPPKEEYWDYIVERRDLLVPQDIRERKGSFFTPQIWVELSQKYLTDVLGEDWQDEYYIWDCAAGTGNLLHGLTNKYNIWASTLDKQDVEVMHDRINNGANLLHEHVFQFDFLNDDFSKLPKPLQDIVNNEEKRKKLVVYINPPYAEGGSSKQKTGTGEYKKGVNENNTHDKYHEKLSGGNRELFAQFLARIYFEIPNSKIAEFSKLKILQSSHFSNFRQHFLTKLEKIFLVPAATFDNVKGKFPIGFKIWNTDKKDVFKEIEADVYNEKAKFLGTKKLYSYENSDYYSKFVNSIKLKTGFTIGWLEGTTRNSFQHNSIIQIINSKDQMAVPRGMSIFSENLIKCCVCYSVRKVIEATWLNDRDQFLFPNDGWVEDKEFQNDCLAYTLFHGQNRVSSKEGTNHWIPFTEYEVSAREKFDSDFMTRFIEGKLKQPGVSETLFFYGDMYSGNNYQNHPLEFSAESKAVFNSGRDLWRYFHSQPGCNVNASLYDIREHFQGRNEKGKMNSRSEDEDYNNLIKELRERLKILATKIEPKVYEYGFLLK
jgi:hypothetical protein